MAKLTKADIAFLERHGIPLSATFDASGLSRAEYSERMKAEGKFAAYGVTRCSAERHSLRNRHGTCLRCFPASIAFINRAESAGYLYVARSRCSGLIKIGFSSNQVDNRLYIANLEGFAGCYDWTKRATWKSRRAGRVEIAIHQSLSAFAVRRCWPRNGSTVESKEVFKCTLKAAIDAVNSLLTEAERRSICNWY